MASKSIMLRDPLKNCHLLGEVANRRRYSKVNQVMHTTSTKANFSLSVGLPSLSWPWNSGSVFNVKPIVDMMMNVMLSTATTFKKMCEKKRKKKKKTMYVQHRR